MTNAAYIFEPIFFYMERILNKYAKQERIRFHIDLLKVAWDTNCEF